ncbi:GTP cyclohydrolase II [Kineococcus xinjiangensis]|uniref:GTP cyclohydrolase-2 n=1 Tax=Kineococcus xinjiangensis TaxID=512762 RepID=A0A2S6INU3_9ACTN|nr:GTP cyclohydrolase II [Kineococcus xinjiangensis]PPK95927.1 GTP cyclohydrolase II [Kineococcus xinjiangensis]
MTLPLTRTPDGPGAGGPGAGATPARAGAVPGAAVTVTRVASTRLPTTRGEFTAVAYRDSAGAEHLALVAGDVAEGSGVLVRLHSECLTGDVLGSLRCDCGPQLDAALAAVTAEGRGVVVYLRGHEGRGIGLADKIAAYALQEAGRDTVEANLDLGLPVDARDFSGAAAVLRDLGVRDVRLLTHNPAKVAALAAHGVDVVERVDLPVAATGDNVDYLRTKRDRMGHRLPGVP